MEEAKKLYWEYVEASRAHEQFKKIGYCAPKHAYTRRKNGVKHKIRVNTNKNVKSKKDTLAELSLKAYVRLFNANEKFQAAAKKLSDKDAIKLMNETYHGNSI